MFTLTRNQNNVIEHLLETKTYLPELEIRICNLKIVRRHNRRGLKQPEGWATNVYKSSRSLFWTQFNYTILFWDSLVWDSTTNSEFLQNFHFSPFSVSVGGKDGNGHRHQFVLLKTFVSDGFFCSVFVSDFYIPGNS